MIEGQNTDVEFKGKIFHVQTEDWGKEKPFLVTRVFYGGKVLGSIKTNYSSWVNLKEETLYLKLKNILLDQHMESIKKIQQGKWS